MSKLEWYVMSETKDHIIICAPVEYGEWMLSTIKPKSHYAGELFREVKLKLRTNHPELSRKELVQRLTELREDAPDENVEAERDSLYHHMSHIEIGSFQSWSEALLMAQMLHEGDAGLSSFTEMMAVGDWNIRAEFPNQRGVCKIFENGKVKSLDLMLVEEEGTFDLNLNRNAGIYNLGMITRYGFGMSKRGRNAMPPQVGDYRRVGLRWTEEIVRLRKARGGLFRKPTSIEGVEFPVGLPD